ncbi:MAG: 1-deoxy-D-xylulose-5-phosphate reductoisomerase [Candidatus Cloacimonetes bacterium]|nr:1-deoxy-D-xylulose-5-phosphate reductoisomerase [Candidatus Cloacimonadota bacterium]
MKKKIALLGATGSVGTSTLEVVKEHQDKFEIILATAHNNYLELVKAGDEFNIPNLAITNRKIKFDKSITSSKIIRGEDELLQFLQEIDYDILLNAIVGSAGFKYTIKGLKEEKIVALANKESLVMCGDIINDILRKSNAKLLPVDSEHSAIMQCLMGTKDKKEIRKIILTASGGAFRDWKKSDFPQITIADTLNHPTWDMGNKITVDSATMGNKGLEIIEAHHLFHLPYEKIEAVIHPQSIIHSFVEFIDGSILSQLSYPDMKIPIQLALSYPRRIEATSNFTNIATLPDLTFIPIDYKKYPLLEMAYKVGKNGGIMPTVFNAANEAAVNLFLKEEIAFTDIAKIVECYLNIKNISNPDLETIIAKDKEIKEKVYSNYK